MAKATHREPIVIEDVWLEDKQVAEFLDSQLKKTTRSTYTTYMKRLLEFTECKESGAEILRNHKSWERRIFVFYNWLVEKGYSQNYCESCTGCLRGFFCFFRKPLNLTSKERIKLSNRNRITEDYYFDTVDLFKMYLSGTIKGKYVVAVGKSIGLRSEDFAKLTYGQFRSLKLDSEVPISLGAIPTSKEGVKAYCFLDADAVQAVKDILEANMDKPDSAKVWNGNDDDLSPLLRRLAKKAKIVCGDKQVRFHCLRKFLCDRLSSYMGESKWKQIVGKKISESAYVSPNLLREDFIRAMSSLSISNGNGETKKKVSELESEIARLRAEKESLGKKLAQSEEVRMKSESAEAISRTQAEDAIRKMNERLTAFETQSKQRKKVKPGQMNKPRFSKPYLPKSGP